MMIQKHSRKGVMANADVDPAATELLFEAGDVAELVAEATGEEVTAEVAEDGETVTFTVGEGDDADVFEVTAEGDEPVLEASRKQIASKKPVSAATKPSRTIRKVPSAK